PALRTEAGAVLTAQRLHRQRQIKLLAQDLIQVDPIVSIHARIEILFRDLALVATEFRRRQIPHVERGINWHGVRLEASAARQLELGSRRSFETEPILVL